VVDEAAAFKAWVSLMGTDCSGGTGSAWQQAEVRQHHERLGFVEGDWAGTNKRSTRRIRSFVLFVYVFGEK